ncbi:hypothetical protein GQX73_g5931 [Xylaria multiplex]|uniref:FAD-binding FR-type domain-containing protein n=1 Tax=Xylaria multiplex TaxID=323545 RepID=A0A7C8ML41_9PEZI|nr:hypothetical protein GQX73_g5931 [Xylaria multiplex]
MASTPSPTPAGGASSNAWMVVRLKVNSDILSYYAISLTGLIAIFILGHWTRRLAWSASRSTGLYPITALTRIIRKGFLRKLSGFTSIGHAVLVAAYVGLNALFSFYRVDSSKAGNYASRFGWMATANLAFVDAGTYTGYFIKGGRIYILQQEDVTAGIVLGFAMLFTVLAGVTLRRMKYELFYIIHLVLFVVIVVTLGLHRPHLEEERALIVTIIIAGLWLFDRLLRFTRLAYNSINNEATIYPLPNGGTRIVLKKPMARARPGKHCYVWLPHIRAFETHPFTIVATEPMELIINTYSGFTGDLHKYANENPGATLKVSVEGPYGTLPDPMDYDKVVLVAGGSGATFTTGLAVDMIQRLSPDSRKQIEFIWATRNSDNIAWFTQHLSHLATHECAPKIALKLHLTGAKTIEKTEMASAPIPRSPSQISTIMESIPPSILENGIETPRLSTQASSIALRERELEKIDTIDRVERIEEVPTRIKGLSLPVIYGRPDVEALIREAVASTSTDQRVLIAACGPNNLVDTVRNTTASCIRVDGPSVELHIEQFGW